MDTNKILSADILDLVFDDRNKEYGAYELRKTYPQRVKKSLLITASIAGLVFTGSVLANTLKPDRGSTPVIDMVTLIEIPVDKSEIIPETIKPPEPEQPRTEQYTPPVIVNDIFADKPLPTQDDLDNAQIDVKQKDGPDDMGLTIEKLDDNKGIIEAQKITNDDGIVDIVQIPAKYDGNWEKFLRNNLNAAVPIDNGAPAGTYNVIIQFVVDKQGNVSDIKALTENGYGLEQEAIRVLKKAKGWKPGIQAGREVKSYHRQPITFVVEE